MPIQVQSGDPAFDALPAAVAEWLESSAATLALGETSARGYRSARAATINLCEHARALQAAVYLHPDLLSALDIFLRAPLPDGSLYDHFAPLQENNQDSPNSVASPLQFNDLIRELRLWREALNADSESVLVLAAWRVWQATGNNLWLKSHLPVLSRALEQVWKHPHRWSGELDLPKRAFTLDAWPVEFCGATIDNTELFSTQLGAHTKWCVHPGDAAHLHAACRALSTMYSALHAESEATQWRERAEHLEAQLNSVGWNGQYYTHQIHLAPVRVRGVDEARQLAACNAFAMNSGVANQEQCAAILKEYQRRRELSLETSFSEWRVVQPPFPETAFGVAQGTGANGGIWPVVGGELALAALNHGFENYGVETLRRYYDLAVKPRRSFACYNNDGTAARDNGARDNSEYSQTAHDPAGSATMLRALIEGVCGVRDDGVAFDRIHLAPRWPATGQASAEVEVSYAANSAYISYRWALDGGRMTLDWDCKAKHIDLHILLPRGNTPERVALNGRTHPYALASIEKSKYVDLSTEKKRGTIAITLK